MVVNGRPLKRMKRRVTADLNDFLTFPSGDLTPTAPFRTSVREFLLRHALLPPPSSLLPHLLTWQILFRVGEQTSSAVGGGDASVCLDVVEEDVIRSRSVYCDQCRVVGWSGNPVCGKRYHFIIKGDGASIGGYNKSCAGCGASLHLSDSRCKTCNHVMTTEDIEDWMYNQLDDTNHLLHGVVHVNGYGHLLRVNGREGGSRVLSGTHIMDFWDRLCKVLGVRQVSVMDVSKKYGLDFRLLHSIIKGHPWYGDWGYKFGAGSYGITLEAYNTAIETLANTPLSTLSHQPRKPRTHLQDSISFYQSLSDHKLLTFRDLFQYLTTLIHDANKDDFCSSKKAKLSDSRVLCAWSMGDILRVEEAMFRVLRAVSGSAWVSWRSLRGAVCRVGRPELLDYCLKELKGKQAADGMVVNARLNPDSGSIEYRLEPGSVNSISMTNNPKFPNCPSEDHLLRDLRFLYESLLRPPQQTTPNHITNQNQTSSAQKILDCKQFVKNYHPEHQFPNSNPHSLILNCKLQLTEEPTTINPPPEHLILSSNATIHDLKTESSKAFQDVYLVLRRFEADELVGYGGVDESTQIKLLIGSNNNNNINTITVSGKCVGNGKSGLTRYRMERGVETWTLDCRCGAKDDDGERMLACDGCGVWQHTRCVGIDDMCSVPVKFVCCKCGGDGGGGRAVNRGGG
ncbi:PHD finger protein At1g33420 [Lactuca sativa]|uniref:Zinc finger PHD-type domain-containing protein n=1 Tax=Lactuca sativa TaxID=4236 RepID=A0A9R1XT60_LACSA|nr:PHD finger protein At1g33420 [Lactuca sativa]KAJ0218462.1 hypothetical protein LSAT_V11C300150110 [Lactuca sativa]